MGSYTITLSSVGTSNAQNLDWMASKPVSVALTLSSTTLTADFQVQVTLDDFQNVAAASRSWVGLSTTHYTSAIADAGLLLTNLGPVAGIRLNSTALSSGTITARCEQGTGW